MKRVLSLLLCLMMVLSVVFAIPSSAAGEVVLKPSDVDYNSVVSYSADGIRGLERKGYFGFKDVDLTGINSISMEFYNKMAGNSNGETLLVMVDDPKKGECIGSLTMSELGEKVTVKTAITPTTGTHDLYFYCLYGRQTWNELKVFDITLSPETYVHDTASAKVPDSAIIDNFSDTWVATDDMGRSIATYEEAGDVKTDGREVGILYWNWFIDKAPTIRAYVIPEIVAEKPEAKENYMDPIWDPQGKFYWGTPIFGYYTSYEYWVYRKHAEVLSLAGVDAIFFDYTNSGNNFIPTLNILAQAFRDAKASGVDIPRISGMMTLGGAKSDAFRGRAAIYYNCFVLNDYSDIWYYRDGKPLLFGNAATKFAAPDVDADNNFEPEFLKEMDDFFTIRYAGARGKQKGHNNGVDEWMWLENFPQPLRNVDPETGRAEFVAVGTAINESTVIGGAMTGVFSDQYSKGRGFSEVFGEDYSADGMRKAYFFREQAALALKAAPEFIMVGGWNEWTAVRNAVYNGFPNAFVDTYDYENSRDFEPNDGPLKDDYYMLLTDMIRKFKGVRKAPVASGMTTIDVNGDASQWQNVGPAFINAYQDYERDGDGLAKPRSSEAYHYTTTVVNAIKGAKVSFDAENIYFMVETEKDIVKDAENFLTLYINVDRNRATGWEGYDYVVNKDGIGKLSSFNGNEFTTTAMADLTYSIKGNMLQIAIKRSDIAENATVDLEFKWTDSVDANGNFLNLYKDGSVAPYGRFNYLYTEIEQTTLTDAERNEMYHTSTSVIKAGSPKMIANGGKMYVHEADIRVTPFEENGTLYVPESAYNEIMEYGRSKTEYNSFYNMFFTHHYDMNDELTETENYIWTYSLLDSCEVRVNGKIATLSAPVKYVNGIFFVPVSLIAECYGWEVKSLGNGVYTVSKLGADMATVNAVMGHLN